MMAHNHVLEDDDYEEETDLEDETLRYFEGLVSRDEVARASWMENFSRSLKAWASRPEETSAKKLLEAHLPTALRFSVNSPFKDVRLKLGQTLQQLEKECNYPVPQPLFVGPSSFIPAPKTVSYGCQDESSAKTLCMVQGLYEETFLEDGRLSHIVLLLGFHPSYLGIFVKTHNFLMHGDGPLPLHVRNYLAILAASRHKCSYLVTMQEAEFLKNGGDVNWLQGLQHLPKRILCLLTLNKMMAHQPWFLSPVHMKDILRGVDSWSISELVHAIAIMAHFHGLASFALGCGINPEIDTQLGHTSSAAATADNLVSYSPFYTNPALGVGPTPPDSDVSEPMSPAMSPLEHSDLTQAARLEHYIDSAASDGVDQKTLQDTIMEKLKDMDGYCSDDEESLEQNNIQFAKSASSLGLDSQSKAPVPTPVSLVRYLEDPDFEHEDFSLSSAVTLRAREYSWEDHGFPFVNSLYPDIAPLLDTKFRLAIEMTYRTCGKEDNIDTQPFREAIWYYIHSIKGIRHDDYQYRNVNQLLDRDFKTYIQMVGCFPEKVTNFDFSNKMSGLEFSERVHVNILAMEARVQAELIYSLRTIMAYMK